MFPNLDIDQVLEEEKSLEELMPGGKSYAYDFKKGDFILKNGRLVEIEDIEAVKVWIEKVLITEKFKFKVYKGENEDEYGTTIRKLVLGKKFPVFFLQSELKREVSEALAKHPKIDRIEDFRIDQQMVTLNIYFTVILKDNRTFQQEVSF